MAADTTTSSLSAAMKTFYMSEFLSHFEEVLELYNRGQTSELPRSGGTTANWFRYLPLPIVTSAGTEGVATADLTGKALNGHAITGTVTTWYQYVTYSELLQLQGRDSQLTAGAQLLGQNAAESIERQTLKVICESCIWPLPVTAVWASGALNASVYQEACTANSTSTSTTLVGCPLGTLNAAATNSVLKGGWVVITKGKGYGTSSRISAYTAGTRTITIDQTLPDTPMTTTNPLGYATYFTVAQPFPDSSVDAVAEAGVQIATRHIQKAEEILFKTGGKAFSDGYYVGLIHPSVYTKLCLDTTWVSSQTNRAGQTGLEKNEIGPWSKTKFFRMTTAARYATTVLAQNSFSSTAGSLYVTLILGQNAFGTLALSGKSKPEIIIELPSSGGVANPIHIYGTMAWKLYWAVVPLNANFCVGIMSKV